MTRRTGRLPEWNGSDGGVQAEPQLLGHCGTRTDPQTNVLYSRSVPSSLEINATMAAIEGRVGISGVGLDGDGDVTRYDRRFSKRSVRRLGGITTNKRPVETYMEGGLFKSGFVSVNRSTTRAC